MKIFKISQSVNNGYDTHSDAVVIAENEEQAKRIHPCNTWNKGVFYDEDKKQFWKNYDNSTESYLYEDRYGTWTNDLTKIDVEYIGEAKEGSVKGVVCASFHAG